MRVGARLRAEIITGEIQSSIVVPIQAVHGDSDDAFVFVVNGGGTEQRSVKMGQRSPDLIELTSGVEAGDRISLVAPPDRS